MSELTWYDNTTVESAITAARASEKPLLVDFWSPTCKGCAKLIKITYADPAVRQYLNEHFVLVKYNTKQPNEWFKRLNGSFGHFWHPNIVVLDYHLTELRRSIGYLPPAAFMAELEVGRALHELYHRRAPKALEILSRVAGEKQSTRVAAEALYWAGVAAYRVSGDLSDLAQQWKRIPVRYPHSDWVERADCLDIEFAPSGFDEKNADSITVIPAAGAGHSALDGISLALDHAARRLNVFFYGLFMDQDLLREKRLSPTNVELASVSGYGLRIGRRAGLVRRELETVYGMVMALTPAELTRLYGDGGFQDYQPMAVLGRLKDGSLIPALCYNPPVPPAANERNSEYATRLRAVGHKVGLPEEYLQSIG
jgi:thiol-disulfide isomerase/thioredoxin